MGNNYYQYIKSKSLFFILTIAVVVAIYLAYKNSIYPFYFYMGYTFFELSALELLLLSIAPAALSLFLPKNIDSAPDLLGYFIFFQVLTPSLTVPFYVLESLDLYLWVPYWIIITLCYLAILCIDKIKTIRINLKFNPKQSFYLLVSMSLATVAVLFFSYKPDPSKLFSLQDVYELYSLRMDYRENSEGVNVFARYFFSWDAKVFIPLLVVLGVVFKNRFVLALGIISQILVFAINGQKTVALGLVIVLGVFYLVNKENSGRKFFYIVSGSILAFVALDLLIGVGVFSNLIVRRMFVVPGVLTGYYLDFYGSGVFHQYAESFLASVNSPNYPSTSARVIGLTYFGKEEMAANVNVFATAFANFGLIAVLLESIVLCVLLYVIHSLGKHKNRQIYLGILVLPLIALADSGLFTTILTNGIMVAMLVLLLLGNERANK